MGKNKKRKTAEEKSRQRGRTARNKLNNVRRALALTKSDKEKAALEIRARFWSGGGLK